MVTLVAEELTKRIQTAVNAVMVQQLTGGVLRPSRMYNGASVGLDSNTGALNEAHSNSSSRVPMRLLGRGDTLEAGK